MKLFGNAVIGQSGGPTAAINATLAGVIRGAMLSREIETVYGSINGLEGILENRLTELNGQFQRKECFDLLIQTPAAALGSCRKKLKDPEEDPETFRLLFERFRAANIRYFFYIGGNDSMDTVKKLSAFASSGGSDWEMRFIGVPKTIDNDLFGTDHTPGFGSAAKYIAVSVQEILRDCSVYTVPAVTIVEIMGRDAGWLTASAALPGRISGKAPDYLYFPERSFSYDAFFGDLKEALSRHPNVVVAVSEGIRLSDGTYVGSGAQSGVADVFGHRYLAGTGKVLEGAVRETLGCKVRSVELNILQRCAAHCASKTDWDEAFSIGREAVTAALDGGSGIMVGFCRESDNPYRVSVSSSDVSQIANRIRCLPDEFINPSGNGVTEPCLDYLMPLIVGEPETVWRQGLPVHFEINQSIFRPREESKS